MGLASYQNIYSERFAEIASPLYHCISQKRFKRTGECQKSFDILKIELEKLFLYLLDFELEFKIDSDASKIPIAGVLSQEITAHVEEGVESLEVPIDCFS